MHASIQVKVSGYVGSSITMDGSIFTNDIYGFHCLLINGSLKSRIHKITKKVLTRRKAWTTGKRDDAGFLTVIAGINGPPAIIKSVHTINYMLVIDC